MQVLKKACQNFAECQSFLEEIKDSPSQLIQVYSSKPEQMNKKIIKLFSQTLPLSTLVGLTAQETISGQRVAGNLITILVINFAKSSFELLKSNGTAASAAAINSRIESDTKAVLIFSAPDINGDKLVDILNQSSFHFIAAGGEASPAVDDKTYLFDKTGILDNGLLAVILNGSQLKASWSYNLGWDSISREMEITRAEDRVVYELDGRNIFQVYSEFLGEDIKNKLPSIAASKFPLVLNDELHNVRSAKQTVGEGILFSGELKTGDLVRVGYGSLSEILANSRQLHQGLNFHPELALIYSCTERSQYLKSFNTSLNEELQVIPGRRFGFCTGGEFGLVNNKFYHFNISSTVLYLSEKKEVVSKKIRFNTSEPIVKTEHLFHLSKKVVSELEMINEKMRKANLATGNSKVKETAAEIFKLIFDEKNYTGGIVIKEAENLTKIYLEDQLGAAAYDLFRDFWQQKPNHTTKKPGILNYRNTFLIPLQKEVEALIIILSNEVDLYDIKKNRVFIEQIPNYLKKAVLYESLERNLASLSTLELTSDFLYSTLDIDLLYERILDIIVATMGMSAATIIKKETEQIKQVKSINVEVDSELYYFLKGHYDKIIASEQILIENEIDFLAEIETLIAIPINLNDYQAVLYAMQSKYKQLINENQKKFIRTLANQIRVSIRNALNHHKVKRLSVTDGLTNLYNHSYFHNQLKQKEGEKYSIAIMDIDNFKAFNDQYGHQAGDAILRELSSLLKNEIRQQDLVARYGGEEFVIYLNVVDQRILSQILNRLMKKIREMKIKFEDDILQVTVSIGVSINSHGQYGSEQLIKNADTALYIAKGAGRDMVKFYREIS